MCSAQLLISLKTASSFCQGFLVDDSLGTLNKLKGQQLTVLILPFDYFNALSLLELQHMTNLAEFPLRCIFRTHIAHGS